MANDLTLTAQAVINIDTRLTKVEKGGSTGGGDTGGSDTGSGSTSGLVPGGNQIYTNRYQLYTGTTDATKLSMAQLDANYLVSDALGLMINLQMQRTDISSGNKGKSSTLPVVSGTAKVAGSYVIKASIPYLVASKDVLTKQPLSVDLTGIGEGLGNTIIPPKLTIAYGGDHNLTVTPTEGHDYDDQQNGALYDPQITNIVAFDISDKPQMLPIGKVLWSGLAKNTVVTLDASVAPDFSNVPNGIKVIKSAQGYPLFVTNGASELEMDIPLEKLIAGTVFEYPFPGNVSYWSGGNDSVSPLPDKKFDISIGRGALDLTDAKFLNVNNVVMYFAIDKVVVY